MSGKCIPAENYEDLLKRLQSLPADILTPNYCMVTASWLERVDALAEELRSLRAAIAPRPIETAIFAGSVLGPVFEALDRI